MPQYGYAATLGGFIVVGLIFSLVALSLGVIGTKWIDVVFPPTRNGRYRSRNRPELPVAADMAGLTAKTMDYNVITVSLFTLTVTILGSILFRGFMAIIPILIGVLSGYVLASFLGLVDLAPIANRSLAGSANYLQF